MDEKKVLDWLEKNFNYDTQKWMYDTIPDEILDCIISIMKNNGPHCEHEGNNDFINDFICDKIVYGKQGKITRMWLKECFEEDTKHLFD